MSKLKNTVTILFFWSISLFALANGDPMILLSIPLLSFIQFYILGWALFSEKNKGLRLESVLFLIFFFGVEWLSLQYTKSINLATNSVVAIVLAISTYPFLRVWKRMRNLD